ncbi:Ribonuclease P protein subunit p40 [Nibea albiflora]|nr:Ribonuclease P protein subunit p40 [Nibea albiflora]
MSADLDGTPRSMLVSDRSSFRDEKNRLSSQVEQLHLNYKASVLLPECSSTPAHLDTVFNSFKSFYLIRKLPVYELLDKHFLESTVYQGNTFCSPGVLASTCSPVVSVDLTDSSMAPGGRGYQRLLTGLRSRLKLKTDFLLSLHPGGGASLQDLLSRYDWSEHRPEISSHTLTHLSCPSMQSCDPHSFLEWIGAVDADISCENSSNSFLSSLVCPEPNTTLSRALRISICGLLLPQDIYRLIQQIRCYLEQPQLESWVSLTVHGFADSPVSWGGNEHGVLRGGENFYSLLMFHDHTYHLHLATGAHDTCPQ